MPRIVETTVYELEELSEAAKERTPAPGTATIAWSTTGTSSSTTTSRPSADCSG